MYGERAFRYTPVGVILLFLGRLRTIGPRDGLDGVGSLSRKVLHGSLSRVFTGRKRAPRLFGAFFLRAVRSADCQSALRQRSNRRYGVARGGKGGP